MGVKTSYLRPLQAGLPLSACVIGLVAWLLYFNNQYDSECGLNVADAVLTLDFAQVARRVAEGKGLTTGFIRPVSLRFNPAFFNHPELTHPPLFILALAGAVKIAGGHDITVATVSIIFFWAGVPWLWFFSRKFFGNLVAALVIVLYCLNPVCLRYSINGRPITFLVFLLFLFFYCLYRSRFGSSFWSLAAGSVVGLAYLTRYSYGLWILPAALFLFLDLRPGRLRRLIVLTIGAVVVISPWLIRNWIVVGNPFFTLQGYQPAMFTDCSPGYVLWRGFSASSLLVPRKFFFALKKLLLGLRELYPSALLLTGNFVSVFFLTAVLHRFRNRTFDQFKYMLYLMVALEGAFLSLFQPAGDGLAPFVPWALLVGGGFFVHLVGRIKRVGTRAALTVFFLLLCIIPVSNQFNPRLVPRFRLYNVANIVSICRSLPPDTVLVSDVPWAVAWYGGVPSLWLPYRIEDYEEIRIFHHPPVAGFYLTPFYPGFYFAPQERSSDWDRVYRTGWIPGGWDLNYKTSLPERQIFISREPYP